MEVRAVSRTPRAEMSPDPRHQVSQSLRSARRLQVRIRRSSCLTHQLVQFSLRGGNYQISSLAGLSVSNVHLELRQSVLTDNHECLFVPAEAVNISGVDIKPESVDVNATVLVGPHEGIAGDILHLKESVHHGQFVSDAELLVDINVGRELGVLVQLVEQ